MGGPDDPGVAGSSDEDLLRGVPDDGRIGAGLEVRPLLGFFSSGAVFPRGLLARAFGAGLTDRAAFPVFSGLSERGLLGAPAPESRLGLEVRSLVGAGLEPRAPDFGGAPVRP